MFGETTYIQIYKRKLQISIGRNKKRKSNVFYNIKLKIKSFHIFRQISIFKNFFSLV